MFYSLDSTPPVCSVGKKCMDEGFGFYWPPGETPYFVKPNGDRIDCKMRGKVPVFGGDDQGLAAVSTSDSALAPANLKGADHVDEQGFQVVAPRKGKSRQ